MIEQSQFLAKRSSGTGSTTLTNQGPSTGTDKTFPVTAGETWMIGDNPDADIGGAARLGLKTCWVAPAERALHQVAALDGEGRR